MHFTAQGDIGIGTGATTVLDTIAGLSPQLNLVLGDLSYKAGMEEQFCKMVTDKLGADFPYQLITGNHESNGQDGNIENFVKCLPNKLPGLQGAYGTQRYVDVPATSPLIRFVMVSPGINFKEGKPLDYSKNSERWRWTADAIDGAKNANIPWTVVGMHAPCLSVGRYSCQIGKDLLNMLLNKKVDLVLAGHEHNYQRTYQLGTGAACPALVPERFSPACITNTSATMVRDAGTVFATVGVGGVGLRDINDSDAEAGYFAAWSGTNRDPALGTLDVSATTEQLSARFVPAAGYSFTDAFTIRRP
ncbi:MULTISPECIES: metallophosphoesterase [unclassified Paenarthrobacter]|uniref:metallophosphoesterase n=1 Tax=unclassified Paenarthrobacter TaxID=2634190 RepID=UPI00084E7371|nr:metallophosphoesterase [Paenarthrobacter sp. R1]NKR10625.1 phosphohydrolase [Arthrobacter sp. M5]NKR16466.1 phosphohydrolase [Arthrobacter sp. M6]OEH61425.1 phosphohydrolase [Arthrobacter sp. D4]OEH64411.1 phosphohydrolase [Arthrobacter sp. D2]WIV29195.1 metallophosphoesterase [Paenarthrobacter sp. R1]